MKLDTHESDDNDKIHQNAENIDLFYLLEENNSTIQPIEDKEQTFLQQIDWNFLLKEIH
jgi:hypothetical protein